MPRCATPGPCPSARRRAMAGGLLALTATLTAALAPLAHAQAPRLFEQGVLRGEIAFTQPPEVQLNGQPQRLAPGSRIRGENNLLQLPGTLAGRTVTAHYTVDALGQLREVWILTPAERAREPWPRTLDESRTWRFDPATQAWTRP